MPLVLSSVHAEGSTDPARSASWAEAASGEDWDSVECRWEAD